MPTLRRFPDALLVVVDERMRRGQLRVKYASAQDLRRSFGERWSTKVMPQVLMELMRHSSIETTQKYYVGRNAERTADVLWAIVEEQCGAAGNTFGNNDKKAATGENAEQSQSVTQ